MEETCLIEDEYIEPLEKEIEDAPSTTQKRGRYGFASKHIHIKNGIPMLGFFYGNEEG
jgi:hypothetical protein